METNIRDKNIGKTIYTTNNTNNKVDSANKSNKPDNVTMNNKIIKSLDDDTEINTSTQRQISTKISVPKTRQTNIRNERDIKDDIKDNNLDISENRNCNFDPYKKSSRIVLDIGGHKYSTTLSTLTTLEPNSALAKMFTKPFSIETESDGTYFIDRNGKFFSYILDWLRDNQVPDFPNNYIRNRVLYEAYYYGLDTLIESIINIDTDYLNSINTSSSYPTSTQHSINTNTSKSDLDLNTSQLDPSKMNPENKWAYNKVLNWCLGNNKMVDFVLDLVYKHVMLICNTGTICTKLDITFKSKIDPNHQSDVLCSAAARLFKYRYKINISIRQCGSAIAVSWYISKI